VKHTPVASSATGSLGRVLVDGQGRTLYLFEKDTMDTSTCARSCAGYWPPLLTTARPLAATGVRAGLLGTTRRLDGTLQVTYNHHPLYRFKLDTKAGQTRGQNLHSFGADWYVLSPAGAKIEKRTTIGHSSKGY
jgi:predicted lipoprotein with Yx(FWY)xxD motif